MKISTVCSAISYVVALTIFLPGFAVAAPADVSGAESLSNQQTTANTTQGRDVVETKSPQLHIEELAAKRLDGAEARKSADYNANYLANYQELLSSKLARELEHRISAKNW